MPNPVKHCPECGDDGCKDPGQTLACTRRAMKHTVQKHGYRRSHFYTAELCKLVEIVDLHLWGPGTFPVPFAPAWIVGLVTDAKRVAEFKAATLLRIEDHLACVPTALRALPEPARERLRELDAQEERVRAFLLLRRGVRHR